MIRRTIKPTAASTGCRFSQQDADRAVERVANDPPFSRFGHLCRWLHWFVRYPGYRLGDPLLGSGEVRDAYRRAIRDRYLAAEPKCPSPSKK